MKYLIIILFLFIYIGSSAQEGYQKYYYPNGKVSSEGTFINGKPDGIYSNQIHMIQVFQVLMVLAV